jgi:hypothetical protein
MLVKMGIMTPPSSLQILCISEYMAWRFSVSVSALASSRSSSNRAFFQDASFQLACDA